LYLMPKKHRTTICHEGAYYLAMLVVLFAGAMISEANLLVGLAGMLCGPLLIGWRLLVVSMKRLDVQRTVPQGVCAGDMLVVNVSLTNKRRRMASWAVAAEDQLRRENRSGRRHTIRPTVYFSHVPSGETRAQAYRGRLFERGRYVLGPIKVSTRFPFGLFRRTITFRDAEILTVYPRLGRLTRAWAARRLEAFEGLQRRRQQHSRSSGDYYGVREWQSGDSLRRIHWRSSARHGNLIVRQFEPPRNRDVAVLVDLWQPYKPDTEALQNVELAVSFAATLVADICRKGGSNLSVGISGPEPEWTSGPVSAGLLKGTMERLAVATAASEDHLPKLLQLTLDRIESGSEIVLIGTRPVDLTDRGRFGPLWDDPIRTGIVDRIRLVDTSRSELSELFQVE
jgi:uncharacterized protein (DUF58 family)